MGNPRSKLNVLLDVNGGLRDPFLSHQYVIQSVSIPAFKGTDKYPTFSDMFPKDFFQTRTENVDIPFKAFNVTDRHQLGTKVSFAEYSSFSSFNATFYEDVNCSAMRGFVLWQEHIVDSAGNYNPANRYKAEMVVHLLGLRDSVSAIAHMVGVFPTQITQITLTGSEISRIAVQVSFSIDKVGWTWLAPK